MEHSAATLLVDVMFFMYLYGFTACLVGIQYYC